MAQEQFDSSEAEAVLMEAARRQARSVGGSTAVSRARLELMAAELDIAPETLDEVLAEREMGATEATLRAAYIAERRGTILPHLVPYLSVSLMLFVIWFLSGGGHPWFLYPMMGWGIGMASHVAAVYPASGPSFEAGLEAYKKKVERRERDKERRVAKRADKDVSKKREPQPTAIPEVETWNSTVGQEKEPSVVRVGRRK